MDDLITSVFGEREEPRFSPEWYQQKSEALISLVLAHALALPDEDWQDFREEACSSDPDDWIPVIADYSEDEILSMSHEKVVRSSCVWEGIGAADMRLPRLEKQVIGELDGQPVRYVPQLGAYYWLEPESDELVTIHLCYPAELRS